MKTPSPSLRRILETFAVEHREHLNRLSLLQQALTSNKETTVHFANALRSLHSLKGTSRLLNFGLVERICHLGETLLAPQESSSQIEVWLNGLVGALEDGIRASLKGKISASAEEYYRKLSAFLGEEIEAAQPQEASNLSGATNRSVNVAASQLEGLVHGLTRLAQQPHGFLEALEELAELDQYLHPAQRAISKRLARQLNNYCEQWSRSLGQLRQMTHQLILVPAQHSLGELGSRVRELAAQLGKEAKFELSGGQTLVELPLLQALLEPLNHLITNSIFHGIEMPEERIQKGKPRVGKISLNIERIRESLVVKLSDDGRGIDLELLKQSALKLGLAPIQDPTEVLFLEGFSTSTDVTPMGGRGLGLSAVRERVQELSGRIELTIVDGLLWTLSFSSGSWGMHVLEVESRAEIYAFPSSYIKRLRHCPPQDLVDIDGQSHFIEDGRQRPIVDLATVLGAPPIQEAPRLICLIEFHDDILSSVLRVDHWLSHRLVLVQPIPTGGWPAEMLEGAYPSLNDKLTLVLNPKTLGTWKSQSQSLANLLPASKKAKVVLLVDDSRTARQMAQVILADAGYDVVEAENGQQAWEVCHKLQIDLIVTDIEMPELDGLGLLKRLRAEGSKLPILLLTSLASVEQQQQGLELGADAYLIKQAFDHRLLLDHVRRLI